MKKKTEAKRQAILDVAAEVFREMGFERTSMSEICRRVGGSKATIYNYFPSKDELFFEVMHGAVEAEFKAAHEALDQTTDDITEALQRFGEGFLTLLYSPPVLAVRRLLASNMGQGGLGKLCFEHGPQRSKHEIAAFLLTAMEKGKLRRCDPFVATYHLRGLLESELWDSLIFQLDEQIDARRVKDIVHRAVSAFMAAYGPAMAATAMPARA